jgi:colanic acid/amylovoran biosynthesis glycosyltransferase
MRIAMIVGAFGRLSETFILDEIAGLIDLGHDVRIFARSIAEDEAVHPAIARYRLRERVHVLGVPSGRRRRYVLKALAAAASAFPRHPVLACRAVAGYRDADALFLLAHMPDPHFDVVVAQFGPNGERAARLKKAGLAWPLVTIFRGFDVRWAAQRGPAMYRTLFAHGDLLAGVSRQIVEELVRLGAPPGKVRQLRGGIDLDHFQAPAGPRSWTPPQTLVILTVARLHEVKGLRYAILAVGALARRRPDLALEYRLAGGGPEEAALRELVREQGLEQRVRFLGPVPPDRVAALYQAAHIFLLSSLAEGLPSVIQEAMATELPVLATAVGGVGELVADGETGILVPPKNVEALADGLERLVAARAEWREMGRRGRQVVAAKHDIRRQARELEAVCLEVVAAKAGRPGRIADARPARPAMVSAIIPVRDRPEELARCLAGLLSQKRHCHLQVIVVDDASTGDAVRDVAARHPEITYARLDVPRGSGFARNLGLSRAEGELVWFLDSDVSFLSETTLLAMVSMLGGDPGCGQVGGEALVDAEGRVTRVFGRHLRATTGASFIRFVPACPSSSGPAAMRIDSSEAPLRFECDYIPTSNCMVRRDVAWQVGGFDDAHSGVGEDKDFGFRVKQLGLRSYVAADTVVLHHFSPTGRTGGGLRRHFRTQVRFVARHFGFGGVARMLAVVIAEAAAGRRRVGAEVEDSDAGRFRARYREVVLGVASPRRAVSAVGQTLSHAFQFVCALAWALSTARLPRRAGSVHFDFLDALSGHRPAGVRLASGRTSNVGAPS